MIKEKVVVIGAGVGGLTAAHELIERDFEVEIYDRKNYVGGKAASSRAPSNLPVEHGFRFFPSWYRHVTDTMGRIPVRGARSSRDPSSVADRLVPVHHGLLAYYAREPMPWVTHVPRTADQARTQASFFRALSNAGLSPSEVAFLGRKLAQFFATPETLRADIYEKITWWEYLECDSKSALYQTLVDASTRLLVAAQPRTVSAYTIGRLAQRTFSDAWMTVDRVLDGPTSEVWLDPWADHIRGCGAKIHLGWELASIVLCPGSDTTTDCGNPKTTGCQSGPGPAGGSLNTISHVLMSRVVLRYVDSLRMTIASLRASLDEESELSDRTRRAVENCQTLAAGILADPAWTEAVMKAFCHLQLAFKSDEAKNAAAKANDTAERTAKGAAAKVATAVDAAAKKAAEDEARKTKIAAQKAADAAAAAAREADAAAKAVVASDASKIANSDASILISADVLIWAIEQNTQDSAQSIEELTNRLGPWVRQPAAQACSTPKGLGLEIGDDEYCPRRPWQPGTKGRWPQSPGPDPEALWTRAFNSLSTIVGDTLPQDDADSAYLSAAILETVATLLAKVTTTVFGRPKKVEAQYFVFALPVEQMAYYTNRTAALLFHDPAMSNLPRLIPYTSWMSGIQFYLKEPCHLVEGHLLCMDSEWGLTAIEQTQFWGDTDFSVAGKLGAQLGAEGQKVKSVLSVDISTWDRPGRFVPREAFNCTRDEIAREVWGQLKASVTRLTRATRLRDDMLLGSSSLKATVNFNLDDNLADISDLKKQAEYERARGLDVDVASATGYELPFISGATREFNAEPMLLNHPGSRALRPHARTAIENMFLAADYIRTDTDLACMEGANEAGRRAANAVLETSGSLHPPSPIWTLSVARDAITAVGRMFADGKGTLELAAQSARTAGHLVENLLGVTGLRRFRSPRSGQ